jgi:regulator of sigma E protease
VSWALTILGIVALIVLHELGHFAVAKLVGMRVERFSLFFPPTIARVRRGETEYAIGAIPAGGYVKITGMNPEEIGDMDPELSRRAYYAQPPWKRVAVIFAGPAVNLLIAFAIFWGMLLAGDLNGSAILESLNPSVKTRETTVRSVESGKPAAEALRPGDRILSADGHRGGMEEFRIRVSAHHCAGADVEGCRAATPVHLVVQRAGRTLSLAVFPRYDAREERALLGFTFRGGVERVGPFGAALAALREMGATTTSLVSNLGRAFTSEKERRQIHSIVGITQITHESVREGTGYALVILGFISLVLAVINLFPFLPLDGGHVLWSVAEKVRGRRVSLAGMYRFSSVGIILLLFLVLNGLSNDISRLAG